MRSSLREGAFCGAVIAAGAAFEMLALNRRTINLSSGAFLAATWLVAGLLGGAVIGALGGRAFQIFRRREGDGAALLSTWTLGHLFLPLGGGLVVALGTALGRPLRRRLVPRRARVDRGLVIALVFAIVDRSLPPYETLPPAIARSAPLAPAAPVPGSIPVTISVHTTSAFPEVPAVHVRLRALDSDTLGREAALLTGRLPVRTGAGPQTPRLLPGGGAIARIPDRVGTRALAALFPRATRLEGTPVDPVARIEDVARSGGIPILRTAPTEADPPLFLRVLENDAAPSREVAERILAQGAWLDVTLDASGDDRLALAGLGVAASPRRDEVTLLDVAPTALHLLGLAVPRECDGRVLLERLASPGPGARQPRYRALVAVAADRSGAPAPRVSASTTSR